MAMSYTWAVNPLDAYIEYEDFANTVYTCHWRLNGADGEYSASSYGTVSLDLNDLDPATYVDKDDITETIATDWAKAALGEEQIVVMKAGLKANVDEQMNPTKETFSVGE